MHFFRLVGTWRSLCGTFEPNIPTMIGYGASSHPIYHALENIGGSVRVGFAKLSPTVQDPGGSLRLLAEGARLADTGPWWSSTRPLQRAEWAATRRAAGLCPSEVVCPCGEGAGSSCRIAIFGHAERFSAFARPSSACVQMSSMSAGAGRIMPYRAVVFERVRQPTRHVVRRDSGNARRLTTVEAIGLRRVSRENVGGVLCTEGRRRLERCNYVMGRFVHRLGITAPRQWLLCLPYRLGGLGGGGGGGGGTRGSSA